MLIVGRNYNGVQSDISEVNVRISVKDTGVGIKAKYYCSIFYRFGQGYNEVSEEFGGRGLGLMLTKI